MSRRGLGAIGRWMPVAVATGVGLLVALALSMTTRTTYAATTTSFVSLAGPSVYRLAPEFDPFAGSQFVLQRMNTYAGLAVTPEVLGAVVEDLGLPVTPTQLAAKVTSTATPNSVLLSVTVRDGDASRAAAIANAVAAEQSRVIERSEAAGDGREASPVRVTVVDPAVVERGSLLPRPVSIASGGLAAALLVLGAVALRRRYVASQQAQRSRSSDEDPAGPLAWLRPAAVPAHADVLGERGNVDDDHVDDDHVDDDHVDDDHVDGGGSTDRPVHAKQGDHAEQGDAADQPGRAEGSDRTEQEPDDGDEPEEHTDESPSARAS